MTDWTKKRIDNHLVCSCPTCHHDLTTTTKDDDNNTAATVQIIRDTPILVQPLGEAQPLALQVLKMIQVACIGDSNECQWTGDYGAWLQHMETQHGQHNMNGSLKMDSSQYSRSASVPSLFGRKRPSKHKQGHHHRHMEMLPESAGSDQTKQQDIVLENGMLDPNQPPPPPPHPKPKLQRGSSTKVNRRDNRVKSLKDMKRQYKSVSALNCSSTNDDGSGKSRSRSSKGSRSKTIDDIEGATDVATVFTESTTSGSKLVNGQHCPQSSSEPAESHELEVSYGELDWNASISSIQVGNNAQMDQNNDYGKDSSTDKRNKFGLLKENISEEFSLEFEQERDHDVSTPGGSSAQAIDRSEKLKKQANAKFNKGDFEGARALYSDGISVMTSIITVTKEENELVATLLSNRAVTYFREKNFTKCIEDCDKALEYEPKYEKSYIRKWRALMALGNFEEACQCLEEAHEKIPNSSRVKQELLKAREQKEVMALVNNMIDGGNLQQAKDTIKPLAKTSDNIGLLLVAAMADAGLGLTESALEKVNKALRFNPNHVEALQLRGIVLFLSGEMEKGVRLLQDLLNRHSENKELRTKFEQCQTTLTAFSKGRSYAKRSRYKDAVEQFSAAFSDEALPLPSGTALFCLLKIGKAEALLLSKQYREALGDCLDAVDSQPENAEAWALKAEIMICLGKAQDAKNELSDIRRSWGADNYVIEDAYRKANFELKVKKVDDDLLQLVNDIEAGIPEKVIIDGRDRYMKARSSKSNQSERRLKTNDRRTQMEKQPSRNKSLDRQKSVRRSMHRKDKNDKKSRREHHRGRLMTDESNRTLNTQKTGGASTRDLMAASSGTNTSHRKKKRLSRQQSKG